MRKFTVIRTNRGVIAVELALLSTLLALVLAAAVHFGAAWRVQHLLENAAHEAARVATVTPNLQLNDPVVLAVVDDILLDAGIPAGTYNSRVQFATPLLWGNPVTVQITHRFRSALGLGVDFTLHASSVMRYARFVREKA